MHAIRLHELGPAENLRYEQVADPVPAPDQVRIAVAACGVHVVDTAIRAGVAGGPFPLPDLPHIPGREVAGVVDAVGPGADPTWLGRRVVAHLGMASAGYAELAVCPVASLHAVPDGVPDDQAVAMIGTGRTALGILNLAALADGDVVLVLAAAGGLGALFVQHARHRGLPVVGAAGGAAKVETVAALGATVAVDYDAPVWTKVVALDLGGDRPITVVLDGVGGPYSEAALDLLADGGRRIVYGWTAGEQGPLASEHVARGVTSEVVLGPRMLERGGGLRALEEAALAALARGELVPLVQRFPLAEAAAAHRAIETRATVGKVVLIP